MSWSERVRINDNFGAFGIGLATLPDQSLVCVHRGEWSEDKSDGRLRYAVYKSGAWSAESLLPDHYAANGAALALYGGRLHCVHRGGTFDDWLYLTTYDAAKGAWGKDQKLPGARSNLNPALAVFRDPDGVEYLYCLHRGWELDDRLWYTKYDGHGWTPDALVSNDGHHSLHEPGLTVFDGTLFCVHRGKLGDDNLYYTRFDGYRWTPDEKLPDHHGNEAPALAPYAGKLYCVHVGTDGGLWMCTFNGKTWSGDEQVVKNTHGSSNGVALVPADGKLCCVHNSGPHDPLWWMTYSAG